MFCSLFFLTRKNVISWKLYSYNDNALLLENDGIQGKTAFKTCNFAISIKPHVF